MIKALNKNVQIRMSDGMYKHFENLAKFHGVPVSRLIRAGLWTFLLEPGAGRVTGSASIDLQDEKLKASLINIDWLDIGVKNYEMTEEGHRREEADYKAATEDDGTEEQ
jgi:hypothetical protein